MKESETEFDNRMAQISCKMKELYDSNKMYFSHEDELKLLEIKQSFLNQLIFWMEQECPIEEKHQRIEWEYWNLFNALVETINNNVENCEEIKEEADDFPF